MQGAAVLSCDGYKVIQTPLTCIFGALRWHSMGGGIGGGGMADLHAMQSRCKVCAFMQSKLCDWGIERAQACTLGKRAWCRDCALSL